MASKSCASKHSDHVAGYDATARLSYLIDFRGVRMRAFMDEHFKTMIHKFLADHYITMENYFLDGTKTEANANKYSFVWN